MAITIGDLTTDPAAQSFISAADAEAYLAPERQADWDVADDAAREAALVQASRWLVATHVFIALDAVALVQVGRVAARLAAETIATPIFAGTDTTATVTSERVGPLAVTYATGMTADAAGMAWPWLRTMLAGLTVSREGIGVMVV